MKTTVSSIVFILFTTFCLHARNVQPQSFENSGNTQTLYFAENKGQVTDQYKHPRKDIDFKLSTNSNLNVFIGKGSVTYQFSQPEDTAARDIFHSIERKSEPARYKMYRLDVKLLHANVDAELVKKEELEYYENYFTDWSGEKGVRIKTYAKVIYKNIYPNIDWILYTQNGALKHEFLVRSGGNIADIKLQYDGATALKINKNDGLSALTPFGSITEDAPVSYEPGGKKIQSRFKLSGNILSYETGKYSGDLIIDPIVSWGTYYGGLGTETETDVATDTGANVFITGWTTSTSGIATTGAHKTTFTDFNDGFLVKFNSEGKRLWATYYGGLGQEDPKSVCCDKNGYVYITGDTRSAAGIATTGSHKDSYNDTLVEEGFLVKFASDGSRVWGTYFGDTLLDYSNRVYTDKNGNVYITGGTKNTTGIATSGVYHSSLAGGADAFLAKFNSSGTLTWCTYYGGEYDEAAESMAIDSSGNIFLCGATWASTSGVATTGAHQTSFGGGLSDGFLAKFDSSGSNLLWGTYYGGTRDELITRVVINASGQVYFSGWTNSTSGIASSGSYQSTFGGTVDLFMGKFSTIGTRLWATYYGASATETRCRGLALDTGGNIYFSGSASAYSSISLATPGAHKDTNSGSTDGLLIKFDSSGSRLWATYLGGSDFDAITTITIDKYNGIYCYGETGSNSGIATAGAHKTSRSVYDIFLVKFCDSINAGTLSGADSVCKSAGVTLTASVPGGIWRSKSGRTSVVSGLVTGLTSGYDTIQYIMSNNCLSDTATKRIYIKPGANAGTISGSDSVCVGKSVTLTGSVSGGTWVSKTGKTTLSGSVVSGATSGTDTIFHILTNACTSDTAIKKIFVKPLANAGILSGSDTVCKGSTVTLSSSVSGGIWKVKTGKTSVSAGVVSGITTGTDTILYITTNSCSSDTTRKPIFVKALATAGSLSGPDTVCKGGSITIITTATDGIWISKTGNSTITAGVVNGITPGPDTILYVVTNNCSSDTATKKVFIKPLANAGIITSADSVCERKSTPVSSSVAGGMWYSRTGKSSISAGFVKGITTGVDTVFYVVSNSCNSDTVSKEIYIKPYAVAGTISGADSFCTGKSITLSSSVPGGTWLSEKGLCTISGTTVTGIAAGIETILYLIPNDCGTDTARKSIKIMSAPSTGIISGPNTVCIGEDINLFNPSAGGVWASKSGITAVSAAGKITGLTAGIDTISYTITNMCGMDIAYKQITVEECNTGIENIQMDQGIEIFPNPAHDRVSVIASQTITKAVITNILGQVIQTSVHNNKSIVIDISLLSSGIYFLKINETFIEKIVKQ